MREPKIKKLILSAGATGTNLDKSVKLFKILTGMNPQIIKAGPKQRIPSFGVRPELPLGTRVTIRGKKSIALLKKLLGAVDNSLNKKKVSENHLSFGIKEYVDIPGIEYDREIGIRGFNVTVNFERAGKRVKIRKVKSCKLPKKQHVSKEEIIAKMEEHFKTEFR